MFRVTLLFAALICLPVIWAQPEKTPTAEEIAVREIVDKLFTGMKTGDSAMVHQTFHPEARLSTSYLNKAKKPVANIDSVREFLVAVGTPHTETWDERIHDVDVQVDGTMAHVWAPYHFFLNGEFLHCGVNSFQMVLTENGWKILNLTDTRRTEGCN